MSDEDIGQLLPVSQAQIGDGPVQTVDGRTLHAFLQVGRDFTNWMKDRIAAYGFEEGRDYATDLLANFGEKGQGRPITAYYLTLDMAKELAMVERNDQGKRARLYFIECERRAKTAAVAMAALNDPAAMRGLLLSYTEKVLALQAEKAAMAPKVLAHDRIAAAEGDLAITDAAKALQVRPKTLFDFLSRNGWIYRRNGSDHWVAYQARLVSGDLAHKVSTVHRADGTDKVTEQVKVTGQGLTKLARLLPPAAREVA